jgi:hypothetical protein
MSSDFIKPTANINMNFSIKIIKEAPLSISYDYGQGIWWVDVRPPNYVSWYPTTRP